MTRTKGFGVKGGLREKWSKMQFWYGNRGRRSRFWGLFGGFRFRFVDFLGFGTEFWLGEGYPGPESRFFGLEGPGFRAKFVFYVPKNPQGERIRPKIG